MAVPVEPEMAWPRAGRAVEVAVEAWLMREEGDSASMW